VPDSSNGMDRRRPSFVFSMRCGQSLYRRRHCNVFCGAIKRSSRDCTARPINVNAAA
jgi:hypothetical protein